MEITFYYAPNSSASPIASALAELDVPHRKVTFDLANQDQKQPEFLKLNPNGKVPTLVVDGTPMFESVAILQFLGATFGIDKGLWPEAGTPARLTAHSWASWAYVEYLPVVWQLYLASGQQGAPAELKSQVWADHARDSAQRLLGILDGHLAKTGFVAGDHYTIADLAVAGIVMWSGMVGIPAADHAQVSRWLQTVGARPAVRQEFAA